MCIRDRLEGKTEEQIVEELNRIVEEGMFNISINTQPEFPDGSSPGNLCIENSPANHYLMVVEITLNDTGEDVYKRQEERSTGITATVLVVQDFSRWMAERLAATRVEFM